MKITRETKKTRKHPGKRNLAEQKLAEKKRSIEETYA